MAREIATGGFERILRIGTRNRRWRADEEMCVRCQSEAGGQQSCEFGEHNGVLSECVRRSVEAVGVLRYARPASDVLLISCE